MLHKRIPIPFTWSSMGTEIRVLVGIVLGKGQRKIFPGWGSRLYHAWGIVYKVTLVTVAFSASFWGSHTCWSVPLCRAVPQASWVFPNALVSVYVDLHSLHLPCPTQPFSFYLLLPSITYFETFCSEKFVNCGREAEQNGPCGQLHVPLIWG